MLIRPAILGDMQAVFGLIKELAEYEKAADEVVFDQNEFIKNVFELKRANVLVCEVESKIVGYAIYFYSFSTWLGKAGIYLEDIYVKKESRGNGISTAFFRYLANECKDNNLGRLEWACLNWNEPSIKFYENIKAINQSEHWRVYRLEGESLKLLTKQ